MKASKNIMAILLAVLVLPLTAEKSFSQDRNQSWQFKGQNRASIAALIRDVEKNGNGTAVSAVPVGGYTNLVCGKDGQSSAAANTTCVILNNSTGTIDVGQDSEGNQTATNHTETTQSVADSVLETLAGQN